MHNEKVVLVLFPSAPSVSVKNHLPILPLVSTLSKTPEVFGKTAKHLMKAHLVLLSDLDLHQFCTLSLATAMHWSLMVKLLFAVGELQIQLIKMWLVQDPFKPGKCSSGHYLRIHICLPVRCWSRTGIINRLLSFSLNLPKLFEKQSSSYLSIFVVIICRFLWRSIGMIMKFVRPDLITLQMADTQL